MTRFIFFVLTGVLLSFSAFAADYQDYYRNRGTTLPRTMSSDPMGSPYSTETMMGGTALGSAANMPREARRDHDARVQSEIDEREKRAQAWREPPLKFNIPVSEMPKPNTAK
ncbi:hypothetical protein PQQ75_01425 [Paraburkholderia aspalathi]|uniref:hypothetical protein n=1 Tax=Paraburkholderia aspalathi TaxID=1324617 RepID=UPI001B0EEEA3|nr:hypothetical protein [Paraburkholderia aspalathi]CAE6707332.1 hypothetical protein R75465_00717 [Paraburkholderia aspalathi]